MKGHLSLREGQRGEWTRRQAQEQREQLPARAPAVLGCVTLLQDRKTRLETHSRGSHDLQRVECSGLSTGALLSGGQN